jgi:hypothetical protein
MNHAHGQMDLQEAQEFREDLNEDKEDDDRKSDSFSLMF